ncbi:helix-turn-helix domain-containing protein [Streptomyces sedi]|uniref:Helix-turn-helix domain-containing protein n=1 Tax=Streptomyces sedi TaxID=555059 RepID=A0A5C4UMH2_9ACTN|nr:helix-turn-helix domain-containing protein [Streptomyces sedi]TNM24575.1 helix-turn-helix domain-containing protein [Streptomyces sedi]
MSERADAEGRAGSREKKGGRLGEMLRGWRREAGLREGRRRGLTQEVLAERMNMSVRWYRDVENGVGAVPKPELLERLANVLGLDESARAALYLQAVRLLPAPDPEGAKATEETVEGLRSVVAEMRLPAVLTDEAWNVVAVNGSMVRCFPWMSEPGANLARWLVTTRREALDVFGREAWEEQVGRLRSALRLARSQAVDGGLGALAQELAPGEGAPSEAVAAPPNGPFRIRLPVAAGHQPVLVHVLRPLQDTSARLAVITFPARGARHSPW